MWILGHGGYKQFLQGSVKRPSPSRIHTSSNLCRHGYNVRELRIIICGDRISFCHHRRLRVFHRILFSMKVHHMLKFFYTKRKVKKTGMSNMDAKRAGKTFVSLFHKSHNLQRELLQQRLGGGNGLPLAPSQQPGTAPVH